MSDHPEQAPERTLEQRLADHIAIDRLADDLLPALSAKLSASGLGELEVREGAWKVRLRRPAAHEPVAVGPGGHPMRRASDRAARHPGHGDHGHAPGAVGHAPGAAGPAAADLVRGVPAEDRSPTAAHATHGAPSRPDGEVGPVAKAFPGDTHRLIAASPAVGIYRPLPELRPGTSVRAGDRLGVVDVLGVQQEVVSPADGLVGARLAEADQPVEYGQELLVIELLGDEGAADGSSGAAGQSGEAAGPGAEARPDAGADSTPGAPAGSGNGATTGQVSG